MARMQDNLEWFDRVSDLFISMKDKLIEQQKQLLSKQNKKGKHIEGAKEKIETEYGTSSKRRIPNDEKTILGYTGILSEYGVEMDSTKSRRILTKNLPLLAVAIPEFYSIPTSKRWANIYSEEIVKEKITELKSSMITRG